MIGVHRVLVRPPGGGADVDVSCLADDVTIHHGRDDTTTQPEASSATVNMGLDTDAGDVLPAALEVGAVLTVTTTVAGVTYTRFVGTVADLVTEWDDAAADTPNRPTVQVIATNPLAVLGRRIVGDAPYPQQLDGARVAAVLQAAGAPLDPAYSDPGTVQVLPRDVDAQSATDVVAETALSAGGMLWTTRDGLVRYADANHRRNMTPSVTLDACDVLVTPQWRRTSEGLVNKVSITYGVAAEGADRPVFTASRDDSVARFGRYELATTTALANAADAQAMGQLLLTRNREPVWIMSALPVDMAGLDTGRMAAVLSLDVHGLLELTGLPAAGAAPTTAALWVEGWTETLAWGVHDLTISVSGYCRTVPPPRWDDLVPAITWDTAPGTWDDATCMGPQPSIGRWNDVSASLRWDQVPAATTWDTWTG